MFIKIKGDLINLENIIQIEYDEDDNETDFVFQVSKGDESYQCFSYKGNHIKQISEFLYNKTKIIGEI